MDVWGGDWRCGRRGLVGVEAVDFPEEDLVALLVVLYARGFGDDQVAIELYAVDVVVMDFGRVEVGVIDDFGFLAFVGVVVVIGSFKLF